MQVVCFSNAQKKCIDSCAVINKWSNLGSIIISPNGKYVAYSTNVSGQKFSTLVLQSTNRKWEREFYKTPISNMKFITNDSKNAIFFKSNDTLCISTLGTSIIEDIPKVSSVKYSKNCNANWIAYMINSSDGKLIVRNINNNEIFYFTNVIDYDFCEIGTSMIIKKSDKEKYSSNESIMQFNLLNLTVKTIWEGHNIDNLILYPDGSKLAFTSETQNIKGNTKYIFFYQIGMNMAKQVSDSSFNRMDDKLELSSILKFSKDGEALFITLKEKIDTPHKKNTVMVDVWSYFDTRLQSSQLKEASNKHNYLAVLQLRDERIIQLEHEDEFNYDVPNSQLLVYKRNGDVDQSESFWNPQFKYSIILESTKDGKRKDIQDNSDFLYTLSPSEKFIIYYDYNKMNFFVYQISTGEFRNITKSISTSWKLYDSEQPDAIYGSSGITGWTEDDKFVLIQDQYDIWKIDPTGIIDPQNITNGYGRRNNIVFHICNSELDEPINSKRLLLLSAFNRSNKYNGFFTTTLTQFGDPKYLTMGPYVYYLKEFGLGNAPIKSSKSNSYIISRESSTESPNYFYTKDFKSFTSLSDNFPERSYNWLSSELIKWETPGWGINDGILYKPENFDSSKKYPIIFHYYNKKAQLLNAFIRPGFCTGSINIPWFVSQGYLVFTPDIHFKVGETGECVRNTIESAANYLISRFAFIDKNRMGIQGFSFGGYHTNYLVTHTNIFAAAMVGAGYSDLISVYGGVNKESGVGNQQFIEKSGIGMGLTLWGSPERYINNSPIFKVDKVVTPLLMMNNIQDAAVDFSQAMEFFNALRRLGKRVWLLQYDDGGHGVLGKSAIDYTIRINQFFDHYLKGTAAPRWMTRGIKATQKGIDSGFDLDSIVPPPSIIIDVAN
ncbi:hypothetical protein GCM10022209_32420 [Chitinophaga oryziterrae]